MGPNFLIKGFDGELVGEIGLTFGMISGLRRGNLETLH